MTRTQSDELATLVERLTNQVAGWTPPRWRAASAVSGHHAGSRPASHHAGNRPASDLAGTRAPVARSTDVPGGHENDAPPSDAGEPRASRAEVYHALVQRIADLAADAEGRPRRTVPRLDNDLALPAQLVVVTHDLLHAHPAPDALKAATTAVAETRTAITV